MESWLPFFVIVAALALVLQMAILLVMLVQIRRMNERITHIATDLHARINPILGRLQVLMDDAQPRVSAMLADVAEVTHLARSQAVKVDRVFTEAADRLRLQLIHVDRILTGALETVEEAGAQFRRSLWGPLEKASAFIKGVKVGLDVLRAGKRPSGGDQQDESLFI